MPQFANRIAGAAQFEAIEDIQNCVVPALFVLLRDNVAETIANQTSLRQEVDHGFDILLVQESFDLRKQEAEEISVVFKGLLLDALNGWLPAGYDNAAPLEFGGDSFIEADRSRYVRMYTFNAPETWCGNNNEDDGQALGDFDKFFADLLIADHDDAPASQVQLNNLYNP
jgi:hypothetical protein